MENFKKYAVKNPEAIKGGGRIARTLGWIFGNFFQAMTYAGKGLENSGFNGAGANK